MANTKKDPYYNYDIDPALICRVCYGMKDWHQSKEPRFKKDHRFKPGKKKRGLMHKALGFKASNRNPICLDDTVWDLKQKPLAVIVSGALEMYVNCPACIARKELYAKQEEARKKREERIRFSLKAGRRLVKYGARSSRRHVSGEEGKKQRKRTIRNPRLRSGRKR